MAGLWTRVIAGLVLLLCMSMSAFAQTMYLNNIAANYIPLAINTEMASTPNRMRANGISFRQRERLCMGLALYHEARGEPLDGRIAVAATILNRKRSSAYPDSICDVVYQNEFRFNRCQFSFACDTKSDMPGNETLFAELIEIGETVMKGTILNAIPGEYREFASVLANATHYHRHDIKTAWSGSLQSLGRFGNHVFFKSDRVTSRYRKLTAALILARHRAAAAEN